MDAEFAKQIPIFPIAMRVPGSAAAAASRNESYEFQQCEDS